LRPLITQSSQLVSALTAIYVSDLPGFNGLTLTGKLLIGFVLTAVFTLLARKMRGVTNLGAVAGALCCFVLYTAGGPGAFAALIAVFGLAWVSTRLGYQRKLRLGTAEPKDGRKASQVLANLGVATVCAALYAVTHGRTAFFLALAAALSEAAADTVSSEIGQAFGQKPRLITTWRKVAPGTNGAVSLMGTLSGIAAAVLVSMICVLGGRLPFPALIICVGAAVTGMLADSFMGSWLERPDLLNNDSVNFFGTLLAAAIAYWLA
jgi:uncharacterized protein (TIGR00297 family)